MSAKFAVALIVIISVIVGQDGLTEARYLPTRSQEDRLVKLDELIRYILKPGDRNALQMKDHSALFENGYFSPDEYSVLPDDGYVVPYDSRDVESRIARRILRQQQIAKT